jgi:hypothetical protein
MGTSWIHLTPATYPRFTISAAFVCWLPPAWSTYNHQGCKSLWLTGIWTTPREETDIIDFLMRSACTLLRLSLFRFGATLGLLQVIPALTELTIECGSREVFLNLTAISLGDSPSFLLASTAEMVSARFHEANGCRQLQFFGIIMDAHNAQSNRRSCTPTL